jgi:cell division septum initiation protein DivIVA
MSQIDPPQPSSEVGGNDVDVLALIDELDDVLSNARGVPLSDQVRVDRHDVNELIDAIRLSLPDAVKEARQIVKEREAILTDAQRDRDRLLGEAREGAAREVSSSATVRIAERRADEILGDARRIAHTEQIHVAEWADGILASLERNFDRLAAATRRGRAAITARASAESATDGDAADQLEGS